MLSPKENYFNLLSAQFADNQEILTELINLKAILHLPKGTELYISDIHGEADAFDHILRTGAGNVKEKINDLFKDSLSSEEKNKLALLVAYPEEVLTDTTIFPNQNHQWYEQIIQRLLALLSYTSTKYTRSKVRKALPKQYSYVIEELLYTDTSYPEKADYCQQILQHLILMEESERFIIALAGSIRQLTIDHLHIVGDIFDRGPDADKVMDSLCEYHSVDIQWGNHDILWMGAVFGSKACLITLLRIAARYNYLYEIEHSYGLNLRPLFLFADKLYKENAAFTPKKKKNGPHYSKESLSTLEKVHQALTIIQFKLEGQLIQRRPEFNMSNRLLLDKINREKKSIEINGKKYSLTGLCLQTVSLENAYQLTSEEEYVVSSLLESFQQSLRLKKHIRFLLNNGSMYQVYNNHLLLHGCIPLNEDGSFMNVSFGGRKYSGKRLLDFFEENIRESSKNKAETEDFHTDLIWYCWSGQASPLFGRSQMTTFERYFIEEKGTHKEIENSYYSYRNSEKICQMILKEFGLTSEQSRIINGHTPVKVVKGESPIRGNGYLFVIDGGLSKAYQKTTGIAGYSLLNNSYGFQLVTHQPFISLERLFADQEDRTSLKKVIDEKVQRLLIKETSIGSQLQHQYQTLLELLEYRKQQNH